MGAYKVTPGLNAPIESVVAKMQTASDEGEKSQHCQNRRGGTWPTSTVWTGCENAASNPLQWNLFADVRALSGNDQIVRQRMRRLFEGPLFGDFRGSHEVPEVAGFGRSPTGVRRGFERLFFGIVIAPTRRPCAEF
jgi:hypothetical protein